MFRLTREVRFAINHRDEEASRPVTNACAGYPSLTGLGHFFILAVTVTGDLSPDSSYLLNIKDIDQAIRRIAIPHIAEIVRHRPEEFGAPLLQDLYKLLETAWTSATLEKLVLSLSPFLNLSIHSSERPMTRLSQKFEFAASHRLHNPALSEEKNRQTYGKCNNPHGHGHNYELQVTLAGTPSATGLLVDVPAFEETVARTIIDRFDHKNLNIEVTEFAALIPSVENIAKVIYGLLKPKLQSERTKLASVTVWETPKTWCEYGEE